MIQEILVNVSFLKHTLTKKDSGVVQGDYNSTKFVFVFEEAIEDNHKVRFKMGNPQGEGILHEDLKDLTKPEIILVGHDENGNLYSLFPEAGVYPFELVLYSDYSKLTSAPGWLSVNKRQVSIGDVPAKEMLVDIGDNQLSLTHDGVDVNNNTVQITSSNLSVDNNTVIMN